MGTIDGHKWDDAALRGRVAKVPELRGIGEMPRQRRFASRRITWMHASCIFALNIVRSGLALLCITIFASEQSPAQTSEPTLRIETGTHVGMISAAVPDAAGHILVTAGDDGTARVWSLPDLHLLVTTRVPMAHQQSVLPGTVTLRRPVPLSAVAVRPDGQMAAVASDSGAGFLFNTLTGQIIRQIDLSDVKGTIVAMASSPDGATLALATKPIGNLGDCVLFTRWSDGAIFKRDCVNNGYNAITAISYARDGRLAVGAFRSIKIYDSSGTRVLERPNEGWIRDIKFSHDGRLVAIARGGTKHVMEIRDGRTFLPPRTSDTTKLGAALPSVGWSPDDSILYTTGIWRQNVDVHFFEPIANLNFPNRGAGTPQDGAIGELSGTQLSVLPNGDEVFVEGFQGLVVTAPDGRRIAERPFAHADFRLRGREQDTYTRQFRLSRDGMTVEWLIYGRPDEWLRFNVPNLNFMKDAQPQKDTSNWVDSINGLQITGYRRKEDGFIRLNGEILDPVLGEGLEAPACVAVAHDRALIGKNAVIKLYDRAGRMLFTSYMGSTVARVNLSKDGRLAVAAMIDGTIRWFRTRDGKELLAISFNRSMDEWVAFTPTGYYAASRGGEDLFGWQIDRGASRAADFYPASRFRDRFHRPDIVKLVLQTLDEPTAVRLANAASDRNEGQANITAITRALPPVIDLISAPTHFSSDQVEVKLRVRTPSDAQMMGDLRIQVNGEWLPNARAAFQVSPDGTRTVKVMPLPPMDSVIRIYADNRNGRSTPLSISLKWDGNAAYSSSQQGLSAQRKPRLFILAIGISQYHQPDLRLVFPDHDAEKFAGAMQAQRGKLYSDVVSKVIVDADATGAAIRAGLDWLGSQKAADDVGVLFLAGHGVETPDSNYFFAPADFDPARPRETGVDYKAIRSAVDKLSTAGNKVLMFVDTCHAGAALGPHLTASNGLALATMLSRPEYGIIVLSGSKGDQLSYEDPRWGDGAFTAALLEGIMQGKADAAQTGEITMLNLVGFVTQRVRAMTQQKQDPVLLMPGGSIVDFPIASD
jgi:WD40 repeat protein